MIQVLEPLAELPGVQIVMLVTADGVPIAVPGRRASREEQDALADTCREDVLAALAVGWFREIGSAVSPLSWDDPVRAILIGTRGALIVNQARNSLLVVLLSRGTSPEDVQIAIDGTIRRVERNARGPAATDSSDASSPAAQPPSPLPSKNGNRPELGMADTSNQRQGQREGFSGR